MPAVLFVCTHNVCRSPLTSALFADKLSKRSVSPQWRVESAGTWALADEPPIPLAMEVAQFWGLDISSHRSRCVSHWLVGHFGLVLTMEQGHKEAMQVEFPDLASRIYMLSEMAGATLNIAEPIEGTMAAYKRMMREIDQWLVLGFHRIEELSGATIPA